MCQKKAARWVRQITTSTCAWLHPGGPNVVGLHRATPEIGIRAIAADSLAESLQLSTTKRWLQQSCPCMSVLVRINLMLGLIALV